VLDVDQRVITWRYESSALVSDWLGSWNWAVFDGDDGLTLVPIKLPRPTDLAASETVDPDAILALRPGMQVSLDLQAARNGAEIRRNIVGALERNGLSIAPNQPVRLKVTEELHPPREAMYRQIGVGARRGEEKVQVTGERTLKVVMEVDGDQMWSWSSSVTAPFMPDIKEGESMQEAVNRALAESEYSEFPVPLDAVDLSKAGPFGTSQLTINGIE